MNQIMLFFHVLGAIGMGFYLLLPFFLRRSVLEQRPILYVMYWMNFITQWVLVLQLFSGGHLYFNGNYSSLWITLVLITFTLIGAFGGMFGAYLRRYRKSPQKFPFHSWLRKVRVHAILTSICMFLIIVLMLFPYRF
ncbi:MAG: hypothetical protein M0Z65_04495 [Firmicutes bacterium]|uniref:DUF2306 domain-containing protein n=1 Tax=Melghirimyces thermohalophilus TaxID=1236220 RepID=A0A1G6PN11_9BACL|nr:hypothetical protein [Melghirimyces thermohalophilus]MDA8352442.1 hypothetical protein [Bacillota bacterium]SDC81448.1 hypothetical protein SAMN04488112_11755 [Melghirimyces thermohalophilus]